MKKTNNKGFSLVELIIVIAIMAILAGAIAPALIRYIDKSRKSNDVTSCKTIKTAVETALGNESVYEYLTTGGDYCYIYVTPGKPTADDTAPSTPPSSTPGSQAVRISGGNDSATDINGKTGEEVKKIAIEEIATNIGEKSPKLKYKKNAADTNSKDVPVEFAAVVSKKGTVYVFIATKKDMKVKETDGNVVPDKGFQICPNVCDEYQ